MRHDIDRTIALTAAWLIFAVCCVSPILWMLFASAESESSLTAADALTGERQRSLMGTTLLFGVGVTAFASCAGVPLGMLLARCDPRRVWLPRVLLTLPLVLPSYVLALAWMVLVGTRSAAQVYGMSPAITVLGFSLYPIVMLSAEAAVRMLPAALEESAELTASPMRVLGRITLPLIAAPVSASLLIVFVLAISDFAVPALLRVRVYTTEVFTAFAALYDFRRATMMALPLAGVAAFASIAALACIRWPSTARADRGAAGRRWTGRAQRLASAIALAVSIAAIAVPIGALAITASGSRSRYTDALSLEAIGNTVMWSAAGATLVVLIGTLIGYWRAKAGPRAGHVADALWLTLFAVPATVVGIGIIALWNRRGLLGDLYRTDAVVVFAYFSRFLPIAALLCGAFLRRVTRGAEEAAIVGGASWTRTFTKIVMPMSRGGLAAVWLITFILMFGDVALTILVAPAGESSLAVRAYTLVANSPVEDVARLALVQTGLTLLPVIAIALIARKQVRV